MRRDEDVKDDEKDEVRARVTVRNDVFREGIRALVASLAAAVRAGPVAPLPEADRSRQNLSTMTFDAPMSAETVVDFLSEGLRQGTVRTDHPRYLGLLHQAPTESAVAAAALAAAHNPQLATRSHAPFAVDVEDLLVRAFGERFGYERSAVCGTFTSGGAEANATALFAALADRCPEWAERGVRALPGDPKIYVSAEAHPTVMRASRLAGLGTGAVRVVPVDRAHRMKVAALRDFVRRDGSEGAWPLMVVATAGTTSAGAIDDLTAIAAVARDAGAWMHVDAAWGGLLALVPELALRLDGLARADSIAFDPHKTCSVPLGCGMLLTRHPESLARAFHDRAGYMPKNATRDPYARAMPWSRRFAGAPLFAVLASLGWGGLAERVRGQLRVGEVLKDRLRESGWTVLNDTPLPVACFVDGTAPGGDRGAFLGAVARRVTSSGEGWLSLTRFSNGARALRACVTHAGTSVDDVFAFVRVLGEARTAVRREEVS